MANHKLSLNSALSDDYIYTSDTILSPTSASPLGAFTTDAGPNALFARLDGMLCQLSPAAPGKNAAGWEVTEFKNTSGVTQAVAGVQSDGTVHGFYADDSNLYHIAYDGTSWSGPSALAHCTGVRSVVNPTTGELVITGVDKDGGLLFVRQMGSGGAWAATSIKFPKSLAGLQPVLALTSGACDWVMAVPGVVEDGKKGQLDVYQGSPTAFESGPEPVAVDAPVDQVVLAFWQNASVLFLFTDKNNNLYVNVGTAGNVVKIPNTSVATAAAVVDASNQIHLYATSPDGQLSVLHQTDWNETTGPVWAPNIPLARDTQLLFTDTNPVDAEAFFATDTGGALMHYRKVDQVDPVSAKASGKRVWASGRAQTPGGAKNFQVATYRTQITVNDDRGYPVPNHDISVTASATASVLVKGVAHPIGPSTPVTVTTNGRGQATLSTIASGIDAVKFTFAGDNLPASDPHNPAAGLHNYLQGNGTLNQGTNSARPTFGATTLQNATVNGAPLAPATRDPNNGTALAQAAVSGIGSMLGLAQKAGGSGALAKRGVVGFKIDFSDPARPLYAEYHTEKDFAAARHQLLFRDGSVMPESWWDDIADFFEDAWEGLKNGVISVVHVLVHVGTAVADLAVQIGDDIASGVKWLTNVVIDGIETAVTFVQGILAKIAAFIEMVIDWLKMLFDWGDMWNTMEALESALDQAFPYLKDRINAATGLTSGFFSSIEKTVSDAFDSVIARFDKQTLQSLSNSTSPLALRAAAGGVRPALDVGDIMGWIDDVQHNWLFEKIESFLGGDSIDGYGPLNQPMQTLAAAFATALDDFAKAFEAFATFIVKSLSDPEDFPNLLVAAFLTAAKEVALAVLAFLDGIIEALLQVMAIACDAVGNIFSREVEVPFLSSLLGGIASLLGFHMPSFSMKRLICLAIAVPLTIAYKAAHDGSQPFPDGDLPKPSSPLAADLSSKELCKYTAAFVALIWAGFDTGLDTLENTDLMLFKVIDVVTPVVLGVFTWPDFDPFSEVKLDTDAEKAGFANWMLGYAPALLSIAFLCSKDKLSRYEDPHGKVLISAIGAAQLVAGIVASAYDPKAALIVGNVIGPLPALLQFLRLTSIEGSTGGVSKAAKLVVDFFAGTTVAIAIAAS